MSDSLQPHGLQHIRFHVHAMPMPCLLSQWTQVWANRKRQWRTGKPGVRQSTGSQMVGQDSYWTTGCPALREGGSIFWLRRTPSKSHLWHLAVRYWLRWMKRACKIEKNFLYQDPLFLPLIFSCQDPALSPSVTLHSTMTSVFRSTRMILCLLFLPLTVQFSPSSCLSQ